MGCKKDKADYQYDYRPNKEAMGKSGARIVNLGSYNQLQANGIKLTNYVVRSNDEVKNYPATTYFPTDGRLGNLWTVPQDLFKADGMVSILVEDKNAIPDALTPVTFKITDQYNNPKDYFVMRGPDAVSGQAELISFPRDITAPSKPDHFKIRIINLSAKPLRSSRMENLVGPLSLSWADGKSVSGNTSNILPGQKSEYIELPYGTYQFKVLTSNGVQVPATKGDTQEAAKLIDPATSTLVDQSVPGAPSTHLTYAPLLSYQPGGVYTIVVYPDFFKYLSGKDETSDLQNGFQVISDITEPKNTTFGRLNLVNALPGKSLNFKIDGKQADKNVLYTKASADQIQINGQHQIEVTDESGQTLLSQSVGVRYGENYTLWVFSGVDGKASLAVVNNNLSGVFSTLNGNNGGEDASFNRRKRQYPFDIRFLNLCPDVPYLSFTRNDGQRLPIDVPEKTVQNLTPGYIPVESPYVRFSQSDRAYSLMAYSSSPGVFPGTWLNDISMLKSEAFIARPELYTAAGRTLPVHEPGVFSVALVGSTKAGAIEKATMIIIKHTR
eukprot:gene2875-3301_t